MSDNISSGTTSHVDIMFIVYKTKLSVSIVERKINYYYCLLNRKFERLGGPFDEIVTVFVHIYNVITSRHIMT